MRPETKFWNMVDGVSSSYYIKQNNFFILSPYFGWKAMPGHKCIK